MVSFYIKSLALLLVCVSCLSFAEDGDEIEVVEEASYQEQEDYEPDETIDADEQDEPEINEVEVEQSQNDEESEPADSSQADDLNLDDANSDYRNNAVFKNSYEDINAPDKSNYKKSSKARNQSEAMQDSPSQQESKILISRKKTDVSDQEFVCDPVISIQAQNKLRFDILKELADEHNFEIEMLESENKSMSLEKNLPLSKVVESITRDMSVVLNFKNEQGCKVLSSIAVLDNEGWSSGASYQSSNTRGSELSEKLQRYKPKFKAPRLVKREDEEPAEAIDPAIAAEQEALQEERRAKRLERKNMRSLNDELENGDELKNNFNVRGNNWKKDKVAAEDIPDMQQYVQEVMDGERQPNMRAMTTKQRSEYMRIRRELRAQQKE